MKTASIKRTIRYSKKKTRMKEKDYWIEKCEKLPSPTIADIERANLYVDWRLGKDEYQYIWQRTWVAISMACGSAQIREFRKELNLWERESYEDLRLELSRSPLCNDARYFLFTQNSKT